MDHPALSPVSLYSMAIDSASAWIDDFAPSMGAAIAYYTVFSIGPLLIIIIALAGLFFGRDAAGGYIYAQLGGLLGEEGASAVQGMVERASNTGEGVIASVVGVVLLVIGATTVFAELQSALDRIWKAPAVKKPEGFWGLIRSRLLSLGLVVSIGFVMVVSLVVSAALAALGKWWGGAFEHFEWLLQALNFVVSLAVMTVLFALMYKILPRVRIGWHDVWIGSAATALLFTIGKSLIGLYIGKSGVVSSFGAAGSLAVLLVWVYYSAQILLLGAEFTWVYAHRYGSRRGQDRPATAKQSVATVTDPRGEGDRATRPPASLPARGAAHAAARTPDRPVVASGVLRNGAMAGTAFIFGAATAKLIDAYRERAQGRPR